MRDLDPAYRPAIEALLRAEGLDDLDDLSTVSTFDEVPLYSRYDQVDFAPALTTDQTNRLLITAAAWYLGVLYERNKDRDYYCMVSVLGWADQAGGGLLSPNFWLTRPSTGTLAHLRFNPPTSEYSAYTADALDGDPDYTLAEGLSHLPGGPYVERVYIRLNAWTHSAR
jgi:Immunity protein 15